MGTVAIVGAGMAGLAAAQRLRAHGIASIIFEKSRGFGGRMSTRRSGDYQFDHGAQYFTARRKAFASAVADWQASGIVGQWGENSYVGTPGMTAPARAMAENLDCVTEALVTSLERGPRGWGLRDADGMIDAAGNGSYSAVILAIPAPQAIPLARSAHANLPELALATYSPCIALMLAFEPETRGTEEWLRPDDSAIAWLARNSSKPGRPGTFQTWVAHARPDWSRAHLEQDPQTSGEILHAHFKALTGIYAQPLYCVAHRWRYALVEQPVGQSCLFDADKMIGACGDWCLGPRVEAAFDSGIGMADTLARALAEASA